MSNLKKDLEEIIDEHADAVLEARDETNTSRAVELQDEADQKATTQIFNLMESVIPEEKVLEVEEPRLYQGVGGGSAPFFCSGCQMSEMDIMENYDEQDGRYYCRCSFWDTPHNAFLDKSGGNWLGWKNKQAAQEYLNNLPTEEAGYNQAIKDIKSKLIDGGEK